MTFKEICDTLKQTNSSTVSEMLLYGINGREHYIIQSAVLVSFILGLLLLFFVPLNGIVLYRTLQSAFNLPAYSNFIIGCMSYTSYILIRNIITEDNLLSVVSNKLFALVAMIIVSLFYMRGGV